MNPLIEEFWNKVGYEVVRSDPDFNKFGLSRTTKWRYSWLLKKDSIYKDIVGSSRVFVGPKPVCIKCYRYRFNDKEYFEEEMLRIIKLKAFI